MNKDQEKKPIQYKRVNIKVDEVSFVPQGANPPADIIMRKNHDILENHANINLSDASSKNLVLKGASQMTLEELQKAFEKSEAEKLALQKAADEATAKLQELEKSAADLEAKAKADAEKKKAEAMATGKEGVAKTEDLQKQFEDLRKSNEDLKKENLAQAEALQKTNDTLELERLAKQGESDYPNIAGKADQKGSLLKAMSKMVDADKQYLTSVLKSANEALGKVFVEGGTAQPANESGESSEVKLDKMAKAYAKDEKVSFAIGYDEIMKTEAGKELYAKSLNEKKPV